MSLGADSSSVSYIYKHRYRDEQVGDLAEREHPFMAMVEKLDEGDGDGYYYAIRTGNGQGLAGTFAKSQSNVSGSKGKQLHATIKLFYGNVTIDGPSLRKARKNDGAFLRLVQQESDGGIEEMGDDLAFQMQRDGTGARGRRKSASTNVITMTVTDDARWFKEGMTVSAGTISAGVVTLRTGTTTVTAVDIDAGTVTLASAAAITSFADNDYLFRDGCDSTTQAPIAGLMAHIPLTAPAAGESFNGIDRSSNPRLYAGVRFNDTTVAPEECIQKVATKIRQNGQRADTALLNPIVWANAALRLNAKKVFDGDEDSASFGFEYFEVMTAGGTVRVFSDPDTPPNIGFVLNLATWKLITLDPFPHVIRDDGGRPELRIYNADGIEIRLRSMADLICTKPGANGTFNIA